MDSSRQPNRIENNTSIVGDITSEADFRIDGTLEGSITTSGKNSHRRKRKNHGPNDLCQCRYRRFF